jgi:hypothetical protein
MSGTHNVHAKLYRTEVIERRDVAVVFISERSRAAGCGFRAAVYSGP